MINFVRNIRWNFKVFDQIDSSTQYSKSLEQRLDLYTLEFSSPFLVFLSSLITSLLLSMPYSAQAANANTPISLDIELEIPSLTGLPSPVVDHGLFQSYRDLAPVVIVIDKSFNKDSPSGQTLTLFVNGQYKRWYFVSTGSNKVKQPDPDKAYKYKAYTPTGYFRPTRLYSDYQSSLWLGAPMPYASFFTGGIAIHGTPDVMNISDNVTGGCVRMFEDQAAEVQDAILSSGNISDLYFKKEIAYKKDGITLLNRLRAYGSSITVPIVHPASGEFLPDTIKSWDTVIVVGYRGKCPQGKLCLIE